MSDKDKVAWAKKEGSFLGLNLTWFVGVVRKDKTYDLPCNHEVFTITSCLLRLYEGIDYIISENRIKFTAEFFGDSEEEVVKLHCTEVLK